MSPRSREVVGAQARAWGWLAAVAGGWRLWCRREEHQGSCQGFRAHLLGLVHGTYSSAGLRPRPWIPFPRKNAVRTAVLFFYYFFAP